MTQPYTTLKGVAHIGENTLSIQLEQSLATFFDWGLLNIGSFTNIGYTDSGTRLRPIEAHHYSKGEAWEGYRKNWVWETGLDYSYQPTHVTGIKVNGTFYSTGTTGTYAFDINYPFGQVVFDNPIPTTSVVEVAYSYKYYFIGDTNTPWFTEFMYNSFQTNDDTFFQYGSGLRAIFSENSVQLPAVIVDVTPSRKTTGKMLGGGKYVSIGTQFHVFAETPWDYKRVMDIIVGQEEKKIYGLDFNVIRDSGVSPLTGAGFLAPSSLNYKELIEIYPWKSIRFMNMNGYEVDSISSLYCGVIRCECEVDCPEL